MNESLVSATKYVNTEAEALFIIIFAWYIVLFASVLTYYVAEISTLFISYLVAKISKHVPRVNRGKVFLEIHICGFSSLISGDGPW